MCIRDSFIDTASAVWLAATTMALFKIMVQKDYDAHKAWMQLSMGVLMVPIPQRLVSFLAFTPLAIFVRTMVVVTQFGTPPWEARWGMPGSAWSLLFDPPAPPDHMVLLPRSSPLVYTYDGFGEGEQASFWLSAWVGLGLVLIFTGRLMWTRDQRMFKAQMLTRVSALTRNTLDWANAAAAEMMAVRKSCKCGVVVADVALAGSMLVGLLISYLFLPLNLVFSYAWAAAGFVPWGLSGVMASTGIVAFCLPIYVFQLAVASQWGTAGAFLIGFLCCNAGVVAAVLLACGVGRVYGM
eukprot:TRINITY_DN25564_c0_g1_i5.p1 TRINITY_DN25564_c0_g1~~TRINITY_DN25564_c0_g1_i5.p1  ORF type:complete len:296 (-),score=55.18 TRINITY_DN25564_c0_g1_i5:20-907(-)